MYWRCFVGVLNREMLKFWQQRSRLLSALVRPLLWLFVFAAGFRSALGLSMLPPYETYILYEEYIVPGLAAMIILFNSMQSSLSMVYDREMGSMKVLLMSPVPRSFLLCSKLVANTLVSAIQVYLFFCLALFVDVQLPLMGYVYALPIIALLSIFLGALGLLLANSIKQLENFAGVMNFVIFPMFFLSSALYPLWKMQEASEWLYQVCAFNPFTSGVELLRFGLYEKLATKELMIVSVLTFITFTLAVRSFRPKPAAVGFGNRSLGKNSA
ncbi:ABC transporter permease [Alteromonas sp. CI.11.F.A3]|uniref:ABC transporter permease n=1 Tax=Alteromonas sp. CI.11.F.A3 TaxID=3079555 RepID=UPI002943B91B|nr:ABC transporter permease [Alteromonas sp. CI.11.F.A3]WOI39363.1 ABC transporter permease [Alteromonas sp. CI.11.F.A3]